MRKVLLFLLASFVLIGCSNESRLEQIKKANQKQQEEKQKEAREIGTSAPESVPQRGFDALKDIKEIRNDEHARQAEQDKTMDEVDNKQ